MVFKGLTDRKLHVYYPANPSQGSCQESLSPELSSDNLAGGGYSKRYNPQINNLKNPKPKFRDHHLMIYRCKMLSWGITVYKNTVAVPWAIRAPMKDTNNVASTLETPGTGSILQP